MGIHSRKQRSQRKGKQSRKQRQQRKQKEQRKQSRRSQRGGGSCAAMPLNRELFAQRGGMAPFGSLDNGYLIDQSARVQAETYPLDQALNELPTVIPKMQGGRRRTQRKQRSQRKQKQRGGMYPIDADTMLLPRGTNAGFSSQFSNEAQVNNLYNEYSGPQGPHTR